jgi:HPt (histidine-containing phosphotransfer) domain-containing protein
MERLRAVLEHNGPRAAGTGHPVGHPVEAPADVTEVLDTGFLASLAGDIGGEGVVEMLRIFLEDAPSHMMAIRHAMTSGAIQTVRREAHALAGAARTVGLTRLGRLAAALQKASEGTGPAAEVVEMLAEALRESLPLAAAWADAHDVTTAPSNA